MKYFKCLIFLTFIFLPLSKINAQSLHGLENPRDRIRLNKVRVQYMYFYKTVSDSSLSSIDLFDTSGNFLSSRMIAGDGSVSQLDSFFYDVKHLLVKKIGYNNDKVFYELNNVNDEKGRPITQTITADSIWHKSETSYSNNGLYQKKLSFDKKDTLIFESFYSKKGELVKSIIISKEEGRKVYKRKYDKSGKMQDVKIKQGNGETAIRYKYDAAGNMVQVNTTVKEKNKTTTSGIAYSYYPNGLVFEKVVLFPNKYVQGNRAYYIYY